MIRSEAVHQRRLHEPAVALGRLPAGQDPRARVASQLDRAEHVAPRTFGDDGTHGDVGPFGRRRFECPHGIDERLEEAAVGADDDHPASRRAFLAGVPHRGSGDDGRRPRRLGVIEHDRRVLPAHLALRRDRLLAGLRRDRASHGIRAGERDGVDAIDQAAGDVAASVDDLENVFADVRSEDPLEQRGTRGRFR